MDEKISINDFMDLYSGLYGDISKFLNNAYDKKIFYKKLEKAFSYCFLAKQNEYSKKLLKELCKWYLYDIVRYGILNRIPINRLYSESVDLINGYLNRG